MNNTDFAATLSGRGVFCQGQFAGPRAGSEGRIDHEGLGAKFHGRVCLAHCPSRPISFEVIGVAPRKTKGVSDAQ